MELKGTESQGHIVKWKKIYFNREVENVIVGWFFLITLFTNNDRLNKTFIEMINDCHELHGQKFRLWVQLADSEFNQV